jgi:hypothetical protein
VALNFGDGRLMPAAMREYLVALLAAGELDPQIGLRGGSQDVSNRLRAPVRRALGAAEVIVGFGPDLADSSQRRNGTGCTLVG